MTKIKPRDLAIDAAIHRLILLVDPTATFASIQRDSETKVCEGGYTIRHKGQRICDVWLHGDQKFEITNISKPSEPDALAGDGEGDVQFPNTSGSRSSVDVDEGWEECVPSVSEHWRWTTGEHSDAWMDSQHLPPNPHPYFIRGEIVCRRRVREESEQDEITLPQKSVLTTSEVAKAFGVTPTKACDWFDHGEIKGYRTESQMRRYHRKSVVQFALRRGLAVADAAPEEAEQAEERRTYQSVHDRQHPEFIELMFHDDPETYRVETLELGLREAGEKWGVCASVISAIEQSRKVNREMIAFLSDANEETERCVHNNGTDCLQCAIGGDGETEVRPEQKLVFLLARAVQRILSDEPFEGARDIGEKVKAAMGE